MSRRQHARFFSPPRRSWALRTVATLTTLLLLLPFAALNIPEAEAQLVAAGAEIRNMQGRVEILRRGQTQWVPAGPGGRLADGDEIRSAAGGSAELHLPDNSTLLLAENSRLGVVKLATDSQRQSRVALFHLAVGQIAPDLTQAAVALARARGSN